MEPIIMFIIGIACGAGLAFFLMYDEYKNGYRKGYIDCEKGVPMYIERGE